MGFMPLYQKHHSYGEYVFDWSWANAYDQYQMRYYPKLLTAIPFTPVPAPRLLLTPDQSSSVVFPLVVNYLNNLLSTGEFSSWHLLFPTDDEIKELRQPIKRMDCQYHWHNKDYQSFEDFLNAMTSRKRKNIRKEREKIPAQGIQVKRFSGQDISTELLDQFYIFYHATYLKRGRQGYLNRDFFNRIFKTMRENMMLAMGFVDGKAIAGALFFFDDENLYGRYWGTLSDADALHFEACYYQGIEFCIEQGLQHFNPGTQGEHKIPRGFAPVATTSGHLIAHEGFRQAIAEQCRQEIPMIKNYMLEAESLLPFKQTS